MLKSLVGFVLLGLISLAIYLYYYLGFYLPVEVSVDRRGPLNLIYAEHIGAYHQIGPTIQRVERWAFDNNLECSTTFGEYLDDPASIDQDRLRSRGGCVLATVPGDVPDDLKFEIRGEQKYVVGSFLGSPSISPFKVYPRLKGFIEEERLKARSTAIELYRVNGEQVRTEVLIPLSE